MPNSVFMPRLLPLLVASSLLPATASADLPAPLAPVTVRAAPTDAETVDAAGIQSLRAATSDTASLLRDLPGISLYGAGGVSSLPSIHGLADDRLRIKVDGMDLIASCPNHMNPALSYLDPSQVGVLKVYAGIAPVSVGGDSIGGTIVAATRAPEFAAPGAGSLAKGEAGAFYRSNGNARGGHLAASYATDAFTISYSGATAQSDNYTAGGDFKNYDYTGRIGHTLPRDAVGSTAYETRNHTLGLAFKGGNHLLEARLGYQDLPYQLYPNQRMDILGNQQKRVNLRYLGAFDWGSLEARAYHEQVDHFMDFGADKRYWYGPASGGAMAINGAPCSPIGTTCAAGMPMYSEGKTSGASVRADVALTQRDVLRVGSEAQRYRLDDWWTASGAGMWPNTFLNINDGRRDRFALFGEWEAERWNTQWVTLVGLRYERVNTDAGPVHGYNLATFPANPLPAGAANQTRDAANFNNADRDKTDHNWDLTALARYTVDATQDIEFGLARKVRSPNLYERYTWSTWQMAALMNNFVGDGNGYFGNPALKPEKAHTVSATFDWHADDRRWEFKATPYYTRVADYIDAVQWNATVNAPSATLVQNQFTVLRYVNQSARLVGLDLSGKLPLAKTGFGEFGLKGMLAYTDGENRDTGDNLYNIMPLNAKLTLTQRHGGWDNALELVAAKSKSAVSGVRNEIETPGYSLVNLRGSYSWKQVRVDFGIENLFDRLYYLPLGGAYVGQGTTMTTAAASSPVWGAAVPGMGRSLYTGLTVKF